MDKKAIVISDANTLKTEKVKGKLVKYVPSKNLKFRFEVNERKESERV